MFTPKKYKTGRITRSKARLHKTFPKKKHITRHKQDTIQGSIQDKKVYMTQQQNKTKTYIRETLNLLACAISSNKIPEKLKFYLGKSPVTYLLSPVTCHLWLFTCHMSLMPTATDPPPTNSPPPGTVCWFAKTPKPFFIYCYFFLSKRQNGQTVWRYAHICDRLLSQKSPVQTIWA